ncbi:NAD(P)H-dependent flavin oxidoreductase [Shewanella cyperi]|uniref:NAD(P)H-dependent flavin oxidoreductase n=1 Tax=Shewanella cyperi TaxID=2814292 RepID=UPI001A951096|nr:nitronate monooxygenase [Shewanella cyperi]QSX40011.1 nitronate monooxygenase [Shewanella cyperi]
MMGRWTHTKVTERLRTALPIVQGPFGGGLSSVALASAVSNAGGLGSFGCHHLGAEGIAEVAAAIRANTRGPFALNLWLPFDGSDGPKITAGEYREVVDSLAPFFDELGVTAPPLSAYSVPDFNEQIEALLAARPAVFSFVYGIPDAAILARCRELDIVTLGAATTVEEAMALERAGVDMVVASGFEAGGHRVAFLAPPEDNLMGTFSLVPQIVDALSIPVIAAGGIADGRGIAAAMTLGADGVQIGTAFLACAESGTTDLHRDKLFSEDARHTGLTRVFSGRLARGIRNRLMEEAPHLSLAPYPVQNWLMGQLKRAAIEAARPELMSLWSGQSAPLLRHKRAAELIDSLVTETEAALAGFA